MLTVLEAYKSAKSYQSPASPLPSLFLGKEIQPMSGLWPGSDQQNGNRKQIHRTLQSQLHDACFFILKPFTHVSLI